MTVETIARSATPAKTTPRPSVASLVIASISALFAVGLFIGGAWGLWVDRMDRHDGFVTMGTRDLHTETYALTSELHGDGPRWIYGSTVLGDTRVRATSQSGAALFVGIARTDAVSRYLGGAGYATIQHLVTGDVTTHAGPAPSASPSTLRIWAASTHGTAQQTLLWKPRSGDWSIVLMNVDAKPGVAVRGDLGAKMPLLPWVALALVVLAVGCGLLAAWQFTRALRRRDARSTPSRHETPPTTVAPSVAVGANS